MLGGKGYVGEFLAEEMARLYSKSAAEKDMGFDSNKYYGTGMNKFTFFVENVDTEYERLKSLDMNIEFITIPITYP